MSRSYFIVNQPDIQSHRVFMINIPPPSKVDVISEKLPSSDVAKINTNRAPQRHYFVEPQAPQVRSSTHKDGQHPSLLQYFADCPTQTSWFHQRSFSATDFG